MIRIEFVFSRFKSIPLGASGEIFRNQTKGEKSLFTLRGLVSCDANKTSSELPLHQTPLTPDRRHVERPPPSLQITSNFPVFYGLSHGTNLKKERCGGFLGQDQMGSALPPIFGRKIVQFLLQVPILLYRGHF
jgi:hypothetical protein